MATYKVRIKKDYGRELQDTLDKFKDAVEFYVNLFLREISGQSKKLSQNDAVRLAEKLSVSTSSNPSPKYDFGKDFYKFPSYLRRSAIASAFGKVSSYLSNLERWKSSNPSLRGKKPSTPTVNDVFPAMYHGNCFVRTGTYSARIKVFVRNTWDWIEVGLRKTDADYITRHCSNRKECSPTLSKRGKNWSLDFVFESNVKLPDTGIEERRIVAVDLGINNAATCSVMEPDGTVVARRFLDLHTENDCLEHSLKLIKKAQRSGAKHMPSLWAKVNGTNRNIAEKTAAFITDIAVLYSCDAVVMEHLDVEGKKKGSKRQRLHLWKVKLVQRIVADKCHASMIRIASVCARNTSKLAFDGSGQVLRGRASSRTGGSYSVCEFASGKVYNADLNASYNIGARYYIREILGSMPETARSQAEAKVPSLAKRSTCTLSDLKGLRAVMRSIMDTCAERTMSGKTRDSRSPKRKTA